MSFVDENARWVNVNLPLFSLHWHQFVVMRSHFAGNVAQVTCSHKCSIQSGITHASFCLLFTEAAMPRQTEKSVRSLRSFTSSAPYKQNAHSIPRKRMLQVSPDHFCCSLVELSVVPITRVQWVSQGALNLSLIFESATCCQAGRSLRSISPLPPLLRGDFMSIGWAQSAQTSYQSLKPMQLRGELCLLLSIKVTQWLSKFAHVVNKTAENPSFQSKPTMAAENCGYNVATICGESFLTQTQLRLHITARNTSQEICGESFLSIKAKRGCTKLRVQCRTNMRRTFFSISR